MQRYRDFLAHHVLLAISLVVAHARFAHANQVAIFSDGFTAQWGGAAHGTAFSFSKYIVGNHMPVYPPGTDVVTLSPPITLTVHGYNFSIDGSTPTDGLEANGGVASDNFRYGGAGGPNAVAFGAGVNSSMFMNGYLAPGDSLFYELGWSASISGTYDHLSVMGDANEGELAKLITTPGPFSIPLGVHTFASASSPGPSISVFFVQSYAFSVLIQHSGVQADALQAPVSRDRSVLEQSGSWASIDGTIELPYSLTVVPEPSSFVLGAIGGPLVVVFCLWKSSVLRSHQR